MKKWLSRLWARLRGIHAPPGGLPPVRWLGPNENPFGVEVLDCSVYATSMLSRTKDVQVANQYNALRAVSGEQFRGKSPQAARKISCKLSYSLGHPPANGPVFKSQVMEDKWDIYFFDGYLYFTRSWTGDLFFRAEMRFADGNATIAEIEAALTGFDDDELIVQQVDFLIKSHIFGLASLHPLPKKNRRDPPHVLAVHSFAWFGRRGRYGTFEDTLVTKVAAHW